MRAAIEATRLVGRQPDLALASTDANVPISQGIPAIAIGAGGRGGDAHTHAEWFDNVHGTLGVARALTIVMARGRRTARTALASGRLQRLRLRERPSELQHAPRRSPAPAPPPRR